MFSDILRVLRFPPNLWTLDPYDIMRRYQIYIQAANTIEQLETEKETYRVELANIVNAKRHNKEHFTNDTEFADWAINRAKHTLDNFKVTKDE
jgi:hypothetical protein